MDLFKILLWIHAFFGGSSLLFGLWVIVAKKGNAFHKKLGMAYYFCMVISAVVSLPMSVLHQNYFLFIIGIFTLFMLLSGKRYLQKKSAADVNFIDWGLTATMAVFGAAFVGYGLYLLTTSNSFGIVMVVFGSISFLFVWQDYRNFTGKSRVRNFGLTTHLQRMMGSYIGTVTAFLVVNNTFLPSIVAWLLPTIVLVPLLIRWSKKYGVKAAVK